MTKNETFIVEPHDKVDGVEAYTKSGRPIYSEKKLATMIFPYPPEKRVER